MKTPKQPIRGIGTRLARAGRGEAGSFVNPPVVHASTILFDTVAELHDGKPVSYGRRGTPTMAALESALAELDGIGAVKAAGAVLCPSGLSAMSTAILAFVGAGNRVLLPDSVYGPARAIADIVLKPLDIAVAYYDPTIGAGIADLVDDGTTLVYVESPGSYTMEMQDLPAIAEVAHARDAVVIADNTWATPLYCQPLSLGADVVVHAATKYVSGHADVLMGYVTAHEGAWPRLKRHHGAMGVCAAPDDIYLALRGLRTLEVRLERHMRSGLAVAEWLAARPEVSAVLHPALPGDPGHGLWRRDMTGASGLFSIVLGGSTEEDAARFIEALALFGIGYSWGGYESLAVPGEFRRTASRAPDGPLVRLHVGLEDPADLIADLDAAFSEIAG
ncbi:MAG: cystathionine beta-lyase [Bauldia sp.]